VDWGTKLERGIAGVLHLRPSHDHVAGDLLERRSLHRRHCQGSTHGSEGRPRQCCRGVERMRVGRRAATFFPTGRVVSVLWGPGAWPGSRWSSARPDARGGRCSQVREGGREQKEERELLEKRRGTSASLYLAKDRLADEVRVRRHTGHGRR
jgi:hypothetical protein